MYYLFIVKKNYSRNHNPYFLSKKLGRKVIGNKGNHGRKVSKHKPSYKLYESHAPWTCLLEKHVGSLAIHVITPNKCTIGCVSVPKIAKSDTKQLNTKGAQKKIETGKVRHKRRGQ